VQMSLRNVFKGGNPKRQTAKRQRNHKSQQGINRAALSYRGTTRLLPRVPPPLNQSPSAHAPSLRFLPWTFFGVWPFGVCDFLYVATNASIASLVTAWRAPQRGQRISI